MEVLDLGYAAVVAAEHLVQFAGAPDGRAAEKVRCEHGGASAGRFVDPALLREGERQFDPCRGMQRAGLVIFVLLRACARGLPVRASPTAPARRGNFSV